MTQFIPAVLEQTVEGVLNKIDMAKQFCLDTVHLDVMDQASVRNVCWGDPDVAKDFDINLEVHLMVRDSLAVARKWLALPNVVRVIVRGEDVFDWQEYSDLSKTFDRKLGVAFDPNTSFRSRLSEIENLTFFLAMGVRSGFSGQKFNRSTWGNILAVKSLCSGINIGWDGGVTEELICMASTLDLQVINAASLFWNADDKGKEKIIRLVEG